MRVLWNKILTRFAFWLFSKQSDVPYVYENNVNKPFIERAYYHPHPDGFVTVYSFHEEFDKWLWYNCIENYKTQAIKGLEPIARNQFKAETNKDWKKIQGEYRAIY